MNLVIDNPDNIDLKNFCEYLILEIRKKIITGIDEEKLISYNTYINTKLSNNFILLERPLDIKNILIASSYLLIINEMGNRYEIIIDPNIIIPNTYLKYIDIIKLITYGNMSLPAYPLYNKIMNDIAENLSMLYFKYSGEE